MKNGVMHSGAKMGAPRGDSAGLINKPAMPAKLPMQPGHKPEFKQLHSPLKTGCKLCGGKR